MVVPSYLVIVVLAPLPFPFLLLGLQVIWLLRIKLLDRIGCLQSVPSLVRIGCLQFVLLLQDFKHIRPRLGLVLPALLGFTSV